MHAILCASIASGKIWNYGKKKGGKWEKREEIHACACINK